MIIKTFLSLRNFRQWKFLAGCGLALYLGGCATSARLGFDEIRTTVRTKDLGPSLWKIVQGDFSGILHLGSPEKLSLFKMGETLLKNGGFSAKLLVGKFRKEFPISPPRMGDVSLNSNRVQELFGLKPKPWANTKVPGIF